MMTDEEITALRETIAANPHLLAARGLVRSDPELAIQTIANEIADDETRNDESKFKPHLERVAYALGFKVVKWNDDPKQPKTHVTDADKHGEFAPHKFPDQTTVPGNKVVAGAGTSEGSAS